MANCYRCGKPILDTKYKLRRKVHTGGDERRRYPGGVERMTTRYGLRIVCTKCAHILDMQSGRNMNAENVYILVALTVLFIAMLLIR
jgi:ribosomal protein L44E